MNIQYKCHLCVIVMLWPLENHQIKRWWESRYILPEISSENFEDTLARQDIEPTAIWTNINNPNVKNNPGYALEMDRPCSPKGQQCEHQNCVDQGSWWKERRGRPKNTCRHTVEKGRKELKWHSLREVQVIASDVARDVLCCATSCVLRGHGLDK